LYVCSSPTSTPKEGRKEGSLARRIAMDPEDVKTERHRQWCLGKKASVFLLKAHYQLN